MTRGTDLKKIAGLLHARRKTIQESSDRSQLELRGLKEQERDPEYEEGAQSELADYTLSRLIENSRHELILIDSAIHRLDESSFGVCVDCDLDIPYERLEALPFTLRCEEHAREHEREVHGGNYTAPSL